MGAIVTEEELLKKINILEQELALLKENNKKLASAVENSPAVIVITDKNGNIEYANPTFAATTGYTIDEALGKNPRILQSGLHSKKFYKTMWDTLISCKVWQGEFYNKKKNGSFYWEQAHIAPIKNEAGNITNYVAIKFDITPQKEYEKQLRTNEEKFRTIFELAPLIIMFYDLEFKLIDCNDKLVKYLSASNKEELIGSNILDFLSDKERDRTKESLSIILTNGLITGFEFYLNINGQKRSLEASASLVKDDEGNPKYIIAIIQDITRRKQVEQRLKELIATKDKFFSIIAHYLKNPFSAIVGFSNMLFENIQEFKPGQIQHISSIINDAAKRAAGLIENLLNWSLTQTGSLEFHPQRIILRQLINDVVMDMEIQALKKNISILNEVPELLVTFAEINMLKTILRNLINNAIKYTKPGGQVKVNAIEGRDSVEMTISDTGVGIPPKKLRKLFRLDSKYVTNGTAEEQGIGLGLILCKELVEKHGGSISAESKEGEGSAFKFTLPKPI